MIVRRVERRNVSRNDDGKNADSPAASVREHPCIEERKPRDRRTFGARRIQRSRNLPDREALADVTGTGEAWKASVSGDETKTLPPP